MELYQVQVCISQPPLEPVGEEGAAEMVVGLVDEADDFNCSPSVFFGNKKMQQSKRDKVIALGGVFRPGLGWGEGVVSLHHT